MRLIKTILWKCFISIKFVEKSVDWRWQHLAFQSRTKNFNKALGIAIVLFARALAVGSTSFGGGFKMSLVDVYNYLVAKNSNGILDNSYWKKRL